MMDMDGRTTHARTHHGYDRRGVVYGKGAAVALAVAPQVASQLHLMSTTEMCHRRSNNALAMGPVQYIETTSSKKKKQETNV